jgi:hypothetical protein
VNLSQCGNWQSRSVASGQNLPRQLAGSAAALPLKTAAPVGRRRGRCGPETAMLASAAFCYLAIRQANSTTAAPAAAAMTDINNPLLSISSKAM